MIEHTYHFWANVPDSPNDGVEEFDVVAVDFEVAALQAGKILRTAYPDLRPVPKITKGELMPDEEYVTVRYVGSLEDRSYGLHGDTLRSWEGTAPYTNLSTDGDSLEPGNRLRVYLSFTLKVDLTTSWGQALVAELLNQSIS